MKTMSKRKNNDETVLLCPLGKFFLEIEKKAGTESRFFEHLSRSKIEFLKAVRSLVDARIETLEKEGAEKEKRGKKKENIEVE